MPGSDGRVAWPDWDEKKCSEEDLSVYLTGVAPFPSRSPVNVYNLLSKFRTEKDRLRFLTGAKYLEGVSCCDETFELLAALEASQHKALTAAGAKKRLRDSPLEVAPQVFQVPGHVYVRFAVPGVLPQDFYAGRVNDWLLACIAPGAAEAVSPLLRELCNKDDFVSQVGVYYFVCVFTRYLSSQRRNLLRSARRCGPRCRFGLRRRRWQQFWGWRRCPRSSAGAGLCSSR